LTFFTLNLINLHFRFRINLGTEGMILVRLVYFQARATEVNFSFSGQNILNFGGSQ